MFLLGSINSPFYDFACVTIVTMSSKEFGIYAFSTNGESTRERHQLFFGFVMIVRRIPCSPGLVVFGVLPSVPAIFSYAKVLPHSFFSFPLQLSVFDLLDRITTLGFWLNPFCMFFHLLLSFFSFHES